MTFSTASILVALIVGLAMMPLNIYDVHAWCVGITSLDPKRMRRTLTDLRATAVSFWDRLWCGRFVVGAAVALALLAIHLSATHAVAGVLIAIVPAGVPAEPTMADVKTAIEASNRLFEEFKETNEKRIKAVEQGRAVDPLITEKLDKLNAAIEKQSSVNEQFMTQQVAQEAAIKRFGLTVASGGNAETEAKALTMFNRSLKSNAAARQQAIPADVSAEDFKKYCDAYETYLRRGERMLSPDQVRALSVGSDPAGGWTVTPDLSGRIVTRIFETSPMRQYANSQVIGTDALEGSADIEEADFSWVGETATRSESTTPAVPQPWRIPVHEAASSPRATQKLVEDSNIDIIAWLGKKVGDKMGRGFNTAFVTGIGVAKPRGFGSYTTAATVDASRAWGVFEHIATGTSGGFGTDPNGINKLLDLIHAIKDVYAAKGAFYCNRTTLGKMRQLTDASSAGKYVFIPSFVAGTPDTFLGYPVRKLQDMATYSTADALAVAFGDMEETYQIVDRLGLTVLVDPYTAKPYIVYYTRARVGGDVVNFESMKFLKFNT